MTGFISQSGPSDNESNNSTSRLVSPEILTLEASRGKTCQPKPKAMQIKATQLKLPARSKQVKFCHLTI